MLHRTSFDALGTTVTVVVLDKELLEAATKLAVLMSSAIDRAVNHHNPVAEIHAFDHAEGKKIVVSALLRITLERALLNAELTQGILSPLRCGSDPHPQGPWRDISVEADEVSIPKGYTLDARPIARAALAEDIAHRISSRLATPTMVTVGRVSVFAGPYEPDGGWKFNTAALNHLYDVVSIPNNEAISVTPADELQLTNRPWKAVAVQTRSAIFADALARAAQFDPQWTINRIKETGIRARFVDHSGIVTEFGDWNNAAEPAVNKLLDHTDPFPSINTTQWAAIADDNNLSSIV